MGNEIKRNNNEVFGEKFGINMGESVQITTAIPTKSKNVFGLRNK